MDASLAERCVFSILYDRVYWASEQPCGFLLVVLPFCFFFFPVCSGTVCLLLNFCGRGWFMGSAQHSKVEPSRSLSTALAPSCWSATLPGCTRLVGLVCDPVSHRRWCFQFPNPLACGFGDRERGDRYASRARLTKLFLRWSPDLLLTSFRSFCIHTMLQMFQTFRISSCHQVNKTWPYNK